MEAAKVVVGNIPSGFFLYILSSGLFFVLSSPFDFFSQHVGQSVSPFINLHHLYDDFLVGTVKIFLVSLCFGVFFYLFYKKFSRINQILRERVRPHIPERESEKSESLEETSRLWREQLEFNEWVNRKKIGKYVDFIWSMRMLVAGLFYASEVSFLLNLVSGLLVLFGYLQLLWWIVGSLAVFLMCLAFYASLTNYRVIYNREIEALRALVKEEKKHSDCRFE